MVPPRKKNIIGSRLTKARKSEGLTQLDLSRKLTASGISIDRAGITAVAFVTFVVYIASYLIWRSHHFMTDEAYMPDLYHGKPGPGVLYVSVNEPDWVRKLFMPMIRADEMITGVSPVSE